jgi:hypothetical protein
MIDALTSLSSQWQSLVSSTQQSLLRQQQRCSKESELRSERRHEFIALHIPAAQRTASTPIETALRSVKHPEAHSVLRRLWNRYRDTLLEHSRYEHFYPTATELADYEELFFQSVTFQSAFHCQLWRKHVGGYAAPADLEDLQNLCQLVCSSGGNSSAVRVPHTRKRKPTEEPAWSAATTHEQHTAALLVAGPASIQLLRNQVSAAVQRHKQTLRRRQLLAARAAVMDVQRRLTEFQVDLETDIPSLIGEFSGSYEQTCKKCMECVLDEWETLTTKLPPADLSKEQADAVMREEQRAHLKQLQGMVVDARKDTETLSKQRDTLRAHAFPALDFQVRRNRAHLFHTLFSTCVARLEAVIPELQQQDDADGVSSLLIEMSTKLHGADVHKRIAYEEYLARNTQIGKHIDDAYLSQLQQHRVSIERLSAVHDIALYTDALANTVSTFLADPFDWRKMTIGFIRETRDGLAQCNYMPKAYRQAFDEKYSILTGAVRSVTDRFLDQTIAYRQQLAKDYEPKLQALLSRITAALDRCPTTAVELDNDDDASSVLLPPVCLSLDDWRDVKAALQDAQHKTITEMESRDTIPPRLETQLTARLTHTRDFLQTQTTSLPQCWHAVQRMTQALQLLLSSSA